MSGSLQGTEQVLVLVLLGIGGPKRFTILGHGHTSVRKFIN
jgi:hypothetical protein